MEIDFKSSQNWACLHVKMRFGLKPEEHVGIVDGEESGGSDKYTQSSLQQPLK